jgi:hypothetical protein
MTLEEAMWKIHARSWAAGDIKAGAKHAAEMWAIADQALHNLHVIKPKYYASRYLHKDIVNSSEFPAYRAGELDRGPE